MNRILHLIAATLFLALPIGTFAENAPYISPTPGEIPLIISSPHSSTRTVNAEDLRGVKECGANLMIIKPQFADSVFKYAAGTGLKIITSQQPGTTDIFPEVFAKYSKPRYSSLVGGWLMIDEPYYNNWNPIADNHSGYDASGDYWFRKMDFRELYYELQGKDPGKMVWFNLAVSMEKRFVGGFQTYRDYLRAFNEAIHPPVWFFDLYPLRGGTTAEPKKINVWYKAFYEALDDFRYISDLSGRPFWFYSQCVSYSKDKISGDTSSPITYVFPEPTLEYMRFQVFTAFAFGAKGIGYWYYAQGKDDAPGWYYVTSPVLRDGTRTPVWYILQEVNKEINRYKEVFLDTELVKLYQTNKNYFVAGDLFPGSYGPLSTLTTESGSAPGFFVTHYKKGRSNYVMLTSKSATESQKVSITFDRLAKVSFLGGGGVVKPKVNKSKGGVRSFAGDIEPGGYAIFKWQSN